MCLLGRILTKQLEEIEKQLPDIILGLALVNLDYADDDYKKAYKLFKNGKIREVIKVFELINYNEKREDILAGIQKGNEFIQKGYQLNETLHKEAKILIKQNKLKIKGHRLLFEYQNAISEIEGLILFLKELGRGYEEQIVSMNIHASQIFRLIGRFDEAHNYIERAFNAIEKVEKIDSILVAQAFSGLAAIDLARGEYAKAYTNENKSIQILKNTKEKDFNQIVKSLNNLSLILFNLKEFDRAEKIAKTTIEIIRRNISNDSPELASSLNNLSMIIAERTLWSSEKKGLTEALIFQKEAILILEKMYGLIHPGVGTFYNNLSILFKDLGTLDSAYYYCLKSINIKKEVYDSIHPTLGTSYNSLGTILELQGNYDKAINYYLKSLEVRNLWLRPNHPNIAITLGNLSIVYDKKKEYKKAIEVLKREINIWKENRNKYELASAYDDLSVIYFTEKNYQDALEFQKEAILIWKGNPKYTYKNLAPAYLRLVNIYSEIGGLEEAIQILERLYVIQKNYEGIDHQNTKAVKQLLELVITIRNNVLRRISFFFYFNPIL